MQISSLSRYRNWTHKSTVLKCKYQVIVSIIAASLLARSVMHIILMSSILLRQKWASTHLNLLRLIKNNIMIQQKPRIYSSKILKSKVIDHNFIVTRPFRVRRYLFAVYFWKQMFYKTKKRECIKFIFTSFKTSRQQHESEMISFCL